MQLRQNAIAARYDGVGDAAVGTPPRHRYPALDGLRGIAATAVMVTHILKIGFAGLVLNHTPFRMFVNGRCFVILFFVLSGFVLSLDLLGRKAGSQYYLYASRRLIRIYVPYMFAGLLSILLLAWQGVLPPARAIVDFFTLAGTGGAIGVDLPSWSLVYELRISLLLPLFCWIFVKNRVVFFGLVLALFMIEEAGVVLLGIGQFPYSSETFGGAAIITLRYCVVFAVGIWLASSVMNRSAWLDRVRGAAIPVLAVVAFGLMSALLDQTSTIGAALVIVIALRSATFKRALLSPVLVWLGRVSFSLYLIHVPILVATVFALQGILPASVAVLCGGALSLVAASVFYRLVERPSMVAAQRMKRRTIEASVPSYPTGINLPTN